MTQPVKKPKPGPETAQWVLDTIESYPDLHHQGSWQAQGTECGTTRCVGGWALHAHGMDVYQREPMNSNTYEAGRLLGIEDFVHSDWLFYWTNDEQAVEALRYLAKGEQIPWKQLSWPVDEF